MAVLFLRVNVGSGNSKWIAKKSGYGSYFVRQRTAADYRRSEKAQMPWVKSWNPQGISMVGIGCRFKPTAKASSSKTKRYPWQKKLAFVHTTSKQRSDRTKAKIYAVLSRCLGVRGRYVRKVADREIPLRTDSLQVSQISEKPQISSPTTERGSMVSVPQTWSLSGIAIPKKKVARLMSRRSRTGSYRLLVLLPTITTLPVALRQRRRLPSLRPRPLSISLATMRSKSYPPRSH